MWHTFLQRQGPSSATIEERVNLRCYFPGVHSQYNRVVILPLKLCSHMAYGHVQSRLGCSVCGETILHLAEVAMRARVTGHEDNGANRDISLKKLLCGDYWSDGISVKMKGKLLKGTAGLVSTPCTYACTSRYFADAYVLAGTGLGLAGDVQFSRSLSGLANGPKLRACGLHWGILGLQRSVLHSQSSSSGWLTTGRRISGALSAVTAHDVGVQVQYQTVMGIRTTMLSSDKMSQMYI